MGPTKSTEYEAPLQILPHPCNTLKLLWLVKIITLSNISWKLQNSHL